MTARAQASTIASLKRVSSYEGDYNLYEITIDYDYDLDALIGDVARSDQEYVNAFLKQSFPDAHIHIAAPSLGCSAFGTRSESAVLTGRNYDFAQDTSAMMVRIHPRCGYASIGFACLNYMGANVADKDELSKTKAAAMAPIACLDGVNEKGVSISVLVVDTDAVEQRTGKPAINTSLAIRLVLDRAASTDEAVDLLRSYDMHAYPGRDYHFFINDASGNSVAAEFDPKDAGRSLVATPAREVTNYYALYADEVKPYQRNGNLGHGKERALAIADVLDRNAGAISTEVAWQALRASSQDRNPAEVTSNTQWSIVYDNTHATAEVAVRRNWDDVFTFGLR